MISRICNQTISCFTKTPLQDEPGEAGWARQDGVEVDLIDSTPPDVILMAQVGKLAKKETTKPGIIAEQKYEISLCS